MPRKTTLPAKSCQWILAPWRPVADSTPLLEDVSAAVGLDFVHFNGNPYPEPQQSH